MLFTERFYKKRSIKILLHFLSWLFFRIQFPVFLSRAAISRFKSLFISLNQKFETFSKLLYAPLQGVVWYENMPENLFWVFMFLVSFVFFQLGVKYKKKCFDINEISRTCEVGCFTCSPSPVMAPPGNQLSPDRK